MEEEFQHKRLNYNIGREERKERLKKREKKDREREELKDICKTRSWDEDIAVKIWQF